MATPEPAPSPWFFFAPTMASPMLLNARKSVLTTSPFARHDERLNEAAMLFGPTKIVAHLPGASGWHGESTQEFVSVSHL